jgi:hypothetical protein
MQKEDWSRSHGIVSPYYHGRNDATWKHCPLPPKCLCLNGTDSASAAAAAVAVAAAAAAAAAAIFAAIIFTTTDLPTQLLSRRIADPTIISALTSIYFLLRLQCV